MARLLRCISAAFAEYNISERCFDIQPLLTAYAARNFLPEYTTRDFFSRNARNGVAKQRNSHETPIFNQTANNWPGYSDVFTPRSRNTTSPNAVLIFNRCSLRTLRENSLQRTPQEIFFHATHATEQRHSETTKRLQYLIRLQTIGQVIPMYLRRVRGIQHPRTLF